MLTRATFRRPTQSTPRRAGGFEKEAYKGPVAGATKFQLKKKDKGKADGKEQKEKSRLAQWYEKVGKGLRVSYKKPFRNTDQKVEATLMNKMYRRQSTLLRRIMERNENRQAKLRMLAIEELPVSLQAAARELDLSRLPPEYPMILKEPPLETQEVFGDFMAGAQYKRERDVVAEIK